jgi:formamidopyrimidine-DNA glycosylase
MPELPEIYARTNEIKTALVGKTITGIEILQPKCLNIEPEAFQHALTGACIQDATFRGKWIQVETDRGHLLLNLGMGGEILLTTHAALPEKRCLIFDLDSTSGGEQPCLSINFWWFGYAHYAPPGGLDQHEMTAKLGTNVIDLSLEEFKDLLKGQRSRVKTFLLDQSKAAGIGNFYIHDILFRARNHPLRKIDSLQEDEIECLYHAVQEGLHSSMEVGGAFFELNLFGEKGGYTMESLQIGYQEGKPCPSCGTIIEKIKTGSTSSFICPECQKQ